jgi:hypothetical protein
MDSSILFLLIFFIFAILQGIGQKRRQVDQGQPPPTGTAEDDVPGQGGEMVRSPPRERAEAARRERVQVSPRERAEATRRERVQPAPQPTQQRERSSEGLIPGDIWEEILGLARGETMPRPKPPAAPVPPSPPPPAESREGAVPRKPSAASILRRAAPPVAPVPSEAASAVAAQTRRGVRAGLFGDGSARELRKAVVLKEVLGPPVALKE